MAPINQENTHATDSGVEASESNSVKLLGLIQKGDWATVEHTLRETDRHDSEIHVTNEENGWPPLFHAISANKIVVVERLLELGASLFTRAKDGKQAVHIAASSSNVDLMKLILTKIQSKGADILSPAGVDGKTVLHFACTRNTGGLEVVRLVLRITGSGGKDGRLIHDKKGVIPLMQAADVGNAAVCRELLAQHGDEQVRSQRKDTGDTVLHLACRRKDIELIRLFCEYSKCVDIQNHEGHVPLHISAWEGDETAVKYFYIMKANPNLSDKLDRSPLHIAAERGHTSIVELLVDKFKASVAARTKDGSTLMHIASQCGHPETALMFLKKGVPLHMPNKAGALCFHAAAMQGHVQVIKALAQKGAVIDARDKDNYTSLHLAVRYCRPQVVQALLGYGADTKLKGGKAGETPLHIAARIKNGDPVTEMLLKSGANVNAIQENGETALHIASRYGHFKIVSALLQDGADPTYMSKNGENALHIAVRYCRLEIVKELLTFLVKDRTRNEAVVMVNAQNMEGETCVHYACDLTSDLAHSKDEEINLVKELLQFDPDFYITTKYTSETALHYLCRAGNAKLLQLVVQFLGAANVQLLLNKQSLDGRSPLLIACEEGHFSLVKILLKNNSRVDVFDEHGNAALHWAAANGHLETCDLLLKMQAFVNARTKQGVTALHLAAMNGHFKLVNLLVKKHHAAVDIVSLAKKTPLHMAAQNGQLDVCSALISLSADAKAIDGEGQTPLHLAAESNHSNVVKLFLNNRPELVSIANKEGNTCAHIAASKGSTNVIKGLLRFNKDGVVMHKNRTTDSTALHLAAAGGYTEVVRVLVESGANALEENSEGNTAIHLAAKFGHIGELEVFREFGLDLAHTSVKTGFNALHVASINGQTDFAQEILHDVPGNLASGPPHGTAVESDNSPEYGLTPLHLASQSGHESLVRLLLNSANVQADAQSLINGSTPLHLAAQTGNVAVAGLLLSKSTQQLHIRDKRGRTPLLLAAANGHKEMTQLLIGQGSDVNSHDKNDWRALHYAAKNGHDPVVELLVGSGANCTHETKDGKIALCYAAANFHHRVLYFLMKKEHNTHQLFNDKKFLFDLMICSKMTRDNKPVRDFILLAPAPLETASLLAYNYHQESARKKDRAKELTDVALFCEEVAVDLTTIATGVVSAGAILKAVDYRGVQILDVLMECEQKEVVAHSAVQKYLSDIWMGGLQISTSRILLLFISILFPPCFAFFCFPVKFMRMNKVPIVKMMLYLTSHIYLILLLTMTVAFRSNNIEKEHLIFPHWYEYGLLIMMSGLLLSELTSPSDKSGLGWIKVIVIVMAAISMLIHVFNAATVPGNEQQFNTIYIRNQLLGASIPLTFVQFLDFLTFHHLFGPWAIIIFDLMKDLFRFMILLSLFLLGFTLEMTALNQPAYPKDFCEEINLYPVVGSSGKNIPYTQGLSVLGTQFEKLAFALFGLTDDDDMIKDTVCIPSWGKSLIVFTYGVYLVISIIVLVNLLIAMMSDTYQRIQRQSDTEWKFGRAKLIRSMNQRSPTAPPLNLVLEIMIWIKKLCYNRENIFGINRVSEDEEESESMKVARSGSGASSARPRVTDAPVRKIGIQGKRREGEGAAGGSTGPTKIEDVCDWRMVSRRYKDMHQIDMDELEKSKKGNSSTASEESKILPLGQNSMNQPE